MPFKLPVEIYDEIFRYLEYNELYSTLTGSRLLKTIATRILYRDLRFVRPEQSVLCMHTLARNDALVLLVKSFGVEWRKLAPTHNLYQLLHTVLRRATRLTNLFLELPPEHSPTWLLSGTSFKLRQFTTSLLPDNCLSQFLCDQSTIVELSLHSPEEPMFHLDPSALPHLNHLRTVYMDIPTLRMLVHGRPVESLTLSLIGGAALPLNVLAHSTRSIRSLSIVSFNLGSLDGIFRAVAHRAPHVERLHIVTLVADFSYTNLHAAGPALSSLKSLNYLTCMSGRGDDLPVDKECQLVLAWKKHCPSLGTVVLPGGNVWYQGKDKSEPKAWVRVPD
ncbi:hypothetical protein FISHEDRAFT_50979 [Fistulina hepatica ATCC 64428]|uniref:F-box domain-containing protein n=1 Tax=Fistulina hepatica ATCC 64428 TaxID=1128425 RepID=A0A0D7A2S9_9AGAR|nr:hypothetical protein FISHEDRAFT_50979 [Fistulina hepatica ATCC 64428]